MKTNRIAIALLASAALMIPACIREENFETEDISFEKDEVIFRIGEVKTRSAAENQSESFEVGSFTTENGDTFILEETVTSLDDVQSAPETKSTPAFTDNVKALYGTFFTVALNSKGKSAFEKNNVTTGVKYTNMKDNIWHYHYGEDIWGEGKLPTYFFMRMPGEKDGVTLGDSPYDISDGSITFDYKTPEKAADQKDILFSSYKRTHKTNAEEIVFYHALTGVKFANYFDNKPAAEGKKTTKTIIKSVTISGLKNEGTCTVTPPSSTDANGNVTFGNTKSDEVSIWEEKSLKGKATFTETFDEAFADYTQGVEGENIDLSKLNADAAKQNLNDNNGTKTFFFIPQDLTKTETNSVTLTVVFDVVLDNKTTFKDKELTVTLSDKLVGDHLKWKAGQLHTYTLKPTAVGVDIDDTLEGDVKKDVVVENTGNVWQYVRVNIIGNWMGLVCSSSESAAEDAKTTYPADKPENYVILMGYPNNAKNDAGEYTAQKMVNPWNDKDFYSNGSYRAIDANDIFMSPYKGYGEFVGLPCMADEPEGDNPVGPGGTVGNWIRHDKYYYYMLPIGPGDSVTESLFESYTVGNSPAFWIADKWGTRRPALNVHLEMDLAVQAIEAPMNADGKTAAKTYLQAWTDVLNPTGDEDFNINDL